MTNIVKVKTGTKLEEYSSYSRAVCVDNWIFMSNTAGRNPETNEIPEDLAEQTHQVFANIERALAAVGASLADVVATKVFIQYPEDTYAAMGIFGEKFRGIDPVVTVSNPPLGKPEYKVEIEVTAYKGAGDAEQKRITIGQ